MPLYPSSLDGSQVAGQHATCNSEFCSLPGSLFKPVLHIWPSSVAPTMGNVTLMCTTFMREARCVFKRGGTDLDNRTTLVLTTWASILHNGMGLPGTGEYQLTELQLSDAGYYTCECSENEGTDVLSSDAILLLVTGEQRLPEDDMCQSTRGRKPRTKEKGLSSSEKLGRGVGSNRNGYFQLLLSFLHVCVVYAYECMFACMWAPMVRVRTHICVRSYGVGKSSICLSPWPSRQGITMEP